MSVEEAKQFLRSEPADGGPSLYDHLSQVLLKVIIERPADANKYFEEISAAVRTEATTTAPPPPVSASEEEEKAAEELVPPAKAAQLKWTEAQSAMFVESTEDPPESAVYPDLFRQSSMWQWAGVGFGEEETYRLYLSLKGLAIANDTAVRFWGKMITRGGDYYVAEARTSEEDLAALQEDKTTEAEFGPNKYTYYVSKGTGEPFTPLPHVTPKQIVIARQIKRFLTGDLTAPVCSYPPFPGGTEANFLRAQIAQITADCVLSLKGLVQKNDDVDDALDVMKVEEDAEVDGDPAELSTWVHAEVDIASNGRCQALPEKDEDEEGEAEPAEEQPELKEVCGDISEDVVEETEKALWILRSCPGGAGASPDGLVYARSLKWPGAVAVASGKTVSNVYVGFGVSTSEKATTYTPPMPKAILPEWGFPTEEEEEQQVLTEEADVITAPPKEEEEEEE